MSSTRLVYTRDFVEDIRAYMEEEPLMSGIMGKTATAVAESAKKAVGNRRQGKGLTKVDLRLVNPLVVLPVDEVGDEHLVVDLGEITLKNAFETLETVRHEHFIVAVKALNLQAGGGSHLMENVDIDLKGLSGSAIRPAAKRGSPTGGKVGFEAEVDISEVCANLLPAHFVLIDSVYRCNFPPATSSRVDPEEEQGGSVDASSPSKRDDAAGPPPSTTLVAFRVKQVKLSLLESVGGDGAPRPHTLFALERPSLSYGITGKGHRHLACSVMKLGIVCARHVDSPHAAVLRYYAEPKHVADGRSSLPQLHFEFTHSAHAPWADLNVSLFRPEFVLHPSTLLALYEYLEGLVELLAQDASWRAKKAQAPQTPGAATGPVSRSTRSKPGSDIRILVEVRKPRITVVEDADTEQKTKLVLQSTIVWKGELADGVVRFKSSKFTGLEMFVSSEDDLENMRSVVDPFDLELGVQVVSPQHGVIDAGDCTSIVISSTVEAQLSYQDWVFAVLLVTSWRQCWLGYLNKDASSAGEAAGASPLATPASRASKAESASSPQSPAAARSGLASRYSLVFRCTQIGITVINDCFSGSHMPVLEVRGSDIDGFFGPSNGALVFQTNVALEIDYFNMEIAEWEPFLEFWPLSISRWSTSPTTSDWRIRALRAGNFNLTLGFLECLSLNGKTLFRALESLDEETSVLKSDGSMRAGAKINILHPYHVRNEIGVTIHCSAINDEGETLTVEVEAGSCVPMDIRSSRRNQRKRLARAQLIYVRVGESWEKMEIRIDRVGKQNLVFKPVNPTGTLCRISCNVQLIEGSKHVVLTSSVRVVNKTSHPFSLLFEPDGSQPQEGGMFDLHPRQTLWVPVALVAHCCLRVQPTEGHNWSAPLELRKPPRGEDGEARPRTWLYNAGAGQQGDSRMAFYVWVRMSSPDLFLITVTLTPICTISNQLAVPVSLRMGYGEKRDRDTLPFGISKSAPSLARALPGETRATLGEEKAEEHFISAKVYGPYLPGEQVEMYHFSPEEAVHMQVKMDGLRWSNFARIQLGRRLSGEVELHREVVCCDEQDHAGQQLLSVSVENFVIRDRPTDAGRDRRISLSCPYWIKNMTGLPLSFCLGSPFAGSADHEMALATPRMLQNVQMPDMMKQMPLPSTAALGLPGMTAPSMPSMPSMPSLSDMMTPRPGPHEASYRDSDTMMAGLRVFHDAEEATRSVSHGLVEQPLQLGAAAGGKAREYPALMFSFTATKKRLLFVKVAGSQWSEGIPISNGGASGMVEITNQQGLRDAASAPSLNFLFQLSLTTSIMTGPHHKTAVLTFRPRFVIVNRLAQTVHYRQMGTLGESTLRPQHKTNFHWPDANAPFELCFRLLEPVRADEADAGSDDSAPHAGMGKGAAAAYEWSGGCDIAMLGESHLRLRPLDASSQPLIMRIEVKNHQESLHVVLHRETDRTPPYRILNRSCCDLVVCQAVGRDDGVTLRQDEVAHATSIPYAWDNPLLSHLLLVRVAGVPGPAGKMVVELDAIGKTWSLALPSTEFGPARNMVASIKADGPTKILSITDDVVMSLMEDVGLPRHAASNTPYALAAAELKQADEAVTRRGRAAARAFGTISLSVSLDRVCITFVDKQPQELLAATFGAVSLVYMRGVDNRPSDEDGQEHGRFRSLECAVETFQLDNMLARTPYPVALYSSKALESHEKFFDLSMLEDLNDTVTNVPILKKAVAAIQDLELNLEGRLVLLLYLYHVSFMESLRTLQGHSLGQQGTLVGDDELFAPSTARRVYFEYFSLPAVNLNFSFARRDLGDDEMLAAAEVAQRISWLAASVDNAPLTLKQMELQHAFLETTTLLDVMREHYQKECMRQLYRVVGSVEVSKGERGREEEGGGRERKRESKCVCVCARARALWSVAHPGVHDTPHLATTCRCLATRSGSSGIWARASGPSPPACRVCGMATSSRSRTAPRRSCATAPTGSLTPSAR